MKKQIYFLASLLFLPMAFTQSPSGSEVNTKDVKFLRDWFQSKRAISIKEKGGDLYLSANVSTVYDKPSTKRKDSNSPTAPWIQEFDNSSTSFADNQFQSSAQIFLDYRNPQTWASMRLSFNNFMGVLSGETGGFSLDKAFFGYHLFEDGVTTFDVNIGRNKSYNCFDSKIQYNSLFDGILFAFATSFEQVVDIETKFGCTVIDFTSNSFGFLAQSHLQNIGGTGLYLSYGYTHWNRNAPTRLFDPNGEAVDKVLIRNNPQIKYGISQLIVGYELDPEVLHFPVSFFTACLYNHRARIREEINPNTNEKIFGDHRRGWGFYAGLSAGKIEKQGDLAFACTYQAVATQAIPEWDVAGIGLGNPTGASVYGAIYNEKAPGSYADTFTEFPVGNTNYSGWEFQLMYGLTNNISIVGLYDFSQELSNSFTVPQRYHLFEIEAAYAF